MGNPISNNTACLVLDKAALDACHSLSETCSSTGGWITLGTNLIAIPMISLAGELVIEGIADTGILIRDICQYTRGIRSYEQIQEEKAKVDEVPFWKRGLQTVRRLTTAAALTSIAIVTLKIGGVVSVSNCQSMGASCPEFAGHAVEVCNWTNDFLISVIEQIIKHHFS